MQVLREALFAGSGTGYKYAIDNKINPWNGKPNTVETPYQTPQAKGQEGVNRAKQEIVAQGREVLSQEVTLEVNGVRFAWILQQILMEK